MRIARIVVICSLAVLTSSCQLISKVDDEQVTFYRENASELLCTLESSIAARRIIALADTMQPTVKFDHAKNKDVVEYIEFVLSEVFQISSIQHPLVEKYSSCDQCSASINAEWLSYLTIFCRLADSMGLHFGITKDGGMAVLSKNVNVKNVYYVHLVSGSVSNDVYRVWLNR